MKRLLSALLIGLFTLIEVPEQAFAYRQIPLGGNGTADLAVNLFGPDEVQAGDRFTYSIVITNHGPATASNTTVTYTVPQGISWEGLALRNQFCRQAGNTLTCNYGYLSSRTSATIKVELKATPSTTLPKSRFCPRTIESQVQVAASQVDFDSANNTSPSLRTRITCYKAPRETRRTTDISVELRGPRTVSVPDQLSYAVIVGNGGSQRVTHATVTIPIPSGMKFSSRVSSGECQEIGREVVCTNFGLESGASRVLTVAFAVPRGMACGSNFSTHATAFTASHTSGGQTRTSGTAQTRVECVAKNTEDSTQIPQQQYIDADGERSGARQKLYKGPWKPVFGDICNLDMGPILPCPGYGRTASYVSGDKEESEGGEELKIKNEESRMRDREEKKELKIKNEELIMKDRKDEEQWVFDGVEWMWTGQLPPDLSGRWVWLGKGWVVRDTYRGGTVRFSGTGTEHPYIILQASVSMEKLPSTGADLW